MRDWNILSHYFGTRITRKPDSALMSVRGKNGAAARKLKALADQYPALTIEKDGTGYWIYCDGFDPDSESDPLYGQHFAHDATEALESVNVYIARLTEK